MDTDSRKKAIWGAGLYGGRFSQTFESGQIAFFIDEDETKTYYAGKSVRHPRELDDEGWEGLFIYVPFNYYKEIRQFLRSRGLVESDDFEVYHSKLEIPFERAVEDYRRYQKDLSSERSWAEKTVIWGRLWIKKEYTQFFDWFCDEIDIALISEAIWIGKRETEKLLPVCSVVAPIFADDEAVIEIENRMDIPHQIGLDENTVAEEIEHMRGIVPGHSDDDYRMTIYMLYRYIVESLEHLEIKRVICMDSVTVQHVLLREICRQKGIPVVYTHQGVLPGTLSFDTIGEVGRSLPALSYKVFLDLPINNTEMVYAKRVTEDIYWNRRNRKIQPHNDWKQEIIGRISSKRPTVFLAGQNDVMSHMVPYTATAKKFYSPIFPSTFESVIFFANLCQKKEWNLLYKPHPMYMQKDRMNEFPDNVLIVTEGDVNELIDCCDVVVTILSAISYDALLRNKPVVMLGYNQTRGKGCMYEAFEKEKIEDTIKEALEKGYTAEQQEAFIRHVAQLLKYYLYDDMRPRELRYGKPVPTSFDEFFELERMLEN